MSQSTLKPKRLLFVSSSDLQLSRLAESCFNTEARKMDLNWEATFGTLKETDGIISSFAQEVSEALRENNASIEGSTEPITINILSQCDFVVLLETSGAGCSDFGKRFSGWTGQIETWKISDSTDPVQYVKSQVSKLVVTLILKGGKRAPLSPPDPPGAPRNSSPGQAGTAKVSLDAKGRKGKKVTTVSALTLGEAQLEKLAAELKQLCGSGGTVKDGVIEIQGDQRDRILNELQKRGIKAKRSGG